jgi:hypothetical protein
MKKNHFLIIYFSPYSGDIFAVPRSLKTPFHLQHKTSAGFSKRDNRGHVQSGFLVFCAQTHEKCVETGGEHAEINKILNSIPRKSFEKMQNCFDDFVVVHFSSFG